MRRKAFDAFMEAHRIAEEGLKPGVTLAAVQKAWRSSSERRDTEPTWSSDSLTESVYSLRKTR